MPLYRFLIIVLLFICSESFGQAKHLIHEPQTTVVIPGLRREFVPELTDLRIEVNPGWRAEEIDSPDVHIYELVFTNPDDSGKKVFSILQEPFESKNFDSSKWAELKKSIRISYGDRGIAVRPLDDRISGAGMIDSTGILASYELLTRHPDYIEYVDAIVGKSSLVLLSVPMKTESYPKKINYFRDIAGSIRFGKRK